MRLTEVELENIRASVEGSFGAGTQVWLFGSRIDDQKKGGDIDLYLEPERQDSEFLIDAKLNCLRQLHRQLGNQKIDMVIRRRSQPVELPVYRIARETGLRL